MRRVLLFMLLFSTLLALPVAAQRRVTATAVTPNPTSAPTNGGKRPPGSICRWCNAEMERLFFAPWSCLNESELGELAWLASQLPDGLKK